MPTVSLQDKASWYNRLDHLDLSDSENDLIQSQVDRCTRRHKREIQEIDVGYSQGLKLPASAAGDARGSIRRDAWAVQSFFACGDYTSDEHNDRSVSPKEAIAF